MAKERKVCQRMITDHHRRRQCSRWEWRDGYCRQHHPSMTVDEARSYFGLSETDTVEVSRVEVYNLIGHRFTFTEPEELEALAVLMREGDGSE